MCRMSRKRGSLWRLTTVWASTASYRDSFTFYSPTFVFLNCNISFQNERSNLQKTWVITLGFLYRLTLNVGFWAKRLMPCKKNKSISFITLITLHVSVFWPPSDVYQLKQLINCVLMLNCMIIHVTPSKETETWSLTPTIKLIDLLSLFDLIRFYYT
jgi:hypothetical protein